MQRIATVLTLICGIVLVPCAVAPADTAIYGVEVTVKLKFQHPQTISGKVSSPSPACRRNRRVEVEAVDGSDRSEFVTDGAGTFGGRPAGNIALRKTHRVEVLRTVVSSGGQRRVCGGVVVVLNHG